MKSALFPTGAIRITPIAKRYLNLQDVSKAIKRHTQGDWGELCRADKQDNDHSVTHRKELFSIYTDRHNIGFYVVTNSDRSTTTVLLPEES
jgi:hypothetical protein